MNDHCRPVPGLPIGRSGDRGTEGDASGVSKVTLIERGAAIKV